MDLDPTSGPEPAPDEMDTSRQETPTAKMQLVTSFVEFGNKITDLRLDDTSILQYYGAAPVVLNTSKGVFEQLKLLETSDPAKYNKIAAERNLYIACLDYIDHIHDFIRCREDHIQRLKAVFKLKYGTNVIDYPLIDAMFNEAFKVCGGGTINIETSKRLQKYFLDNIIALLRKHGVVVPEPTEPYFVARGSEKKYGPENGSLFEESSLAPKFGGGVPSVAKSPEILLDGAGHSGSVTVKGIKSAHGNALAIVAEINKDLAHVNTSGNHFLYSQLSSEIELYGGLYKATINPLDPVDGIVVTIESTVGPSKKLKIKLMGETGITVNGVVAILKQQILGFSDFDSAIRNKNKTKGDTKVGFEIIAGTTVTGHDLVDFVAMLKLLGDTIVRLETRPFLDSSDGHWKESILASKAAVDRGEKIVTYVSSGDEGMLKNHRARFYAGLNMTLSSHYFHERTRNGWLVIDGIFDNSKEAIMRYKKVLLFRDILLPSAGTPKIATLPCGPIYKDLIDQFQLVGSYANAIIQANGTTKKPSLIDVIYATLVKRKIDSIMGEFSVFMKQLIDILPKIARNDPNFVVELSRIKMLEDVLNADPDFDEEDVLFEPLEQKFDSVMPKSDVEDLQSAYEEISQRLNLEVFPTFLKFAKQFPLETKFGERTITTPKVINFWEDKPFTPEYLGFTNLTQVELEEFNKAEEARGEVITDESGLRIAFPETSLITGGEDPWSPNYVVGNIESSIDLDEYENPIIVLKIKSLGKQEKSLPFEIKLKQEQEPGINYLKEEDNLGTSFYIVSAPASLGSLFKLLKMIKLRTNVLEINIGKGPRNPDKLNAEKASLKQHEEQVFKLIQEKFQEYNFPGFDNIDTLLERLEIEESVDAPKPPVDGLGYLKEIIGSSGPVGFGSSGPGGFNTGAGFAPSGFGSSGPGGFGSSGPGRFGNGAGGFGPGAGGLGKDSGFGSSGANTSRKIKRQYDILDIPPVQRKPRPDGQPTLPPIPGLSPILPQPRTPPGRPRKRPDFSRKNVPGPGPGLGGKRTRKYVEKTNKKTKRSNRSKSKKSKTKKSKTRKYYKKRLS
jgi:hypothetical protein